MDLKDCEKKGFIRNTKIDVGLIKSLLEMSKNEEKIVREITLTSNNVSTFCTIAYSSLREILEAICLEKGYKISSHVCMGLFLRKNLQDFDYVFFERIRKIRNLISYYGKQIELKQGKELINKIFKLNSKLRCLFN